MPVLVVRLRFLLVVALAAVLGFWLLPRAFGQESDDSGLGFGDDRLTRIDAYLESAQEELGLPGLAAGVVGDGEVVYSAGFGVVEGGGEAVGQDTPFVVASLTKSVTALALLQTVDDGLVDLDAAVAEYLPELAPEGIGVTVRDLMHHRSGVSTFAGRQALAGDLGSSLEANVGRMGPLLDPDAGFEYSNLNYDAMALIVERVSGLAYGQFVEERIFEPVGMVNSKVGPDTSTDGFAQGHYHWLFLGYRPLDAWRPQGVVGAGFVAGSAEDMARLLTVHTNGGIANGNRIVSEESLAILHEPRPYNENTTRGYGGGWHVEPQGTEGTPDALIDYTTLWHPGDWDGYWSTHWVTPQAGVGVVILANGHDQTDLTSLGFVGQNVKHILTGEDTFDIPAPIGDFLNLWGKHLLLALVLVQLSLAAASVTVLSKMRNGIVETSGKAILGTATLVDLAALVLLVWVLPRQVPLTVLASLPDYWTLTLAIGAGVAWGTIRTFLILRSRQGHQVATL